MQLWGSTRIEEIVRPLLPLSTVRHNLYLIGYLSSPFLVSHADIKSATCRLFKSEKGKCVLPLRPTLGRWTTVTSPPRLFTASRHFRAISRRARHPSCPGCAVGSFGMKSP